MISNLIIYRYQIYFFLIYQYKIITILKMKGIYNESLSNKKINIQRIKEQKANNEVSNTISSIPSPLSTTW